MNIQSNIQEKVWEYINRIPKDPLDNSIEIKYYKVCLELGLAELDLRNILKSFEARGLIRFNGFLEGAIIMFP
ncbi:hypothetical protein [Bacteroides congonensis]|uniref:hypothetical protein n=1 Tax=Bacteroides congonensis TaxID=1871006 RepID=UPI001899E5CF|nr:hypothetical protein [Bacteroides congonensis]